MNKHHIPLTDEEKSLVEAIIFDWDRYSADVHEIYLNNKQPVLALVESLARRQGVSSTATIKMRIYRQSG